MRISEDFKRRVSLEEILRHIDSQNTGREAGDPLNLTADQATILKMAGNHYAKDPTIVLQYLEVPHPNIPKEFRNWGKFEDGTGKFGLKEPIERIKPQNPRALNKALNEFSTWLTLEDVATINGIGENYYPLAGRIATIRDTAIDPLKFAELFQKDQQKSVIKGEFPKTFSQYYPQYKEDLAKENELKSTQSRSQNRNVGG